MRLQAQVTQPGVGGVVVMLLRFDARVGHALHRRVQAQSFCLRHHQRCQLVDRKLLSKLVEDPELAFGGRRVDSQLDAPHRVPDVQVAPGLAALAVHSQRVADGGLDDKPVEGRAKDAVIVVPESGVEGRKQGKSEVGERGGGRGEGLVTCSGRLSARARALKGARGGSDGKDGDDDPPPPLAAPIPQPAMPPPGASMRARTTEAKSTS